MPDIMRFFAIPILCHTATRMYPEQLLEHFQNPRNVGELAPPAIAVEVSNPACGDILRLSVLLEAGRIARAAYKVRGCTASIAAGSLLTEWLIGQSRDTLASFDTAWMNDALGGLPPASKHAAVLCADGVKKLRQGLAG
jgi:nitrogen fixation protein NifU and related proteins